MGFIPKPQEKPTGVKFDSGAGSNGLGLMFDFTKLKFS
jgi:hypothetical protein